MAKILFTWELGEGTGHVTPYLDLISQLVAGGHEIHFALRSLHKAFDLFQDTGVTYHQAPTVLPRHVEIMLPVNSYAKVLHHAGYDQPRRLAGLITTWKNLYELIKPELLVVDYSPTAMLAAKNLKIKMLAIGTGFHIPPKIRPITATHVDTNGIPIPGKELEDILNFENRVFNVINDALKLLNMQPLTHIHDLFHADITLLRTVAEFDHYKSRKEKNYAGILKSPAGRNPVWPNYPGPKIFCYLKDFKTLPSLLQFLKIKNYPTLIYGDKLPNELVAKFASDSLTFVPEPLDMKAIGKTADIAICNAGHGGTLELLLAGIPLLLLPLNGEQNLVAKNVERLGAGLSAPQRHPLGMQEKLNTLITNSKYKTSAKAFSEKYKNSNEINMTNVVLDTIHQLLGA